MVRISITAAAYEAIAATLPFGSVGVEREDEANSARQIWLEPRFLDQLKAMRAGRELQRRDLEAREVVNALPNGRAFYAADIGGCAASRIDAFFGIAESC